MQYKQKLLLIFFKFHDINHAIGIIILYTRQYVGIHYTALTDKHIFIKTTLVYYNIV